jgi:hypothetical protein
VALPAQSHIASDVAADLIQTFCMIATFPPVKRRAPCPGSKSAWPKDH